VAVSADAVVGYWTMPSPAAARLWLISSGVFGSSYIFAAARYDFPQPKAGIVIIRRTVTRSLWELWRKASPATCGHRPQHGLAWPGHA